MSVVIENFGCRLNALEGDYVRQVAEQAGLEGVTIVNGCAVTQQAVGQARQAVRRAGRERPQDTIYVTGCVAHSNTEDFAQMKEVDYVLGNSEKLQAESYTRQETIQVGAVVDTPAPMPPQKRARAFVQVQTGCDHRCTFCSIPFGRGQARSKPTQEVIADCRALVERGHKEIVLTGVDITSWGGDLGEAGLGILVKAVLEALPDLPRLRLSSLDAVELDAGFLDLVINEPRLMPHLHLSLQAGDDMILKRMKRRHNRTQAVAFCDRLRQQRPDIVFGADLIAGFPTETEAMFANTLRLIEDCGLLWTHIFPYSPRDGTPASRMPQVAGGVIKQRVHALREEGKRVCQRWLKAQEGKRLAVLMESPLQGRSETFARVRLDAPQSIGALVNVEIVTHNDTDLLGRVQ